MKPDQSSNVDLDAAIDRAVRSMMNVEPRAGMRQRVLSRINEAPREAFPLLRLAIAGGSIAVVALAVTLHLATRPDVRDVQVTTPPPSVAETRGERAAPPVPPPVAPLSPGPHVRRSLPTVQPIPRGLVIAQSVVSGEEENSVGSASSALPETLETPESLRMLTLSPTDRLEPPAATIAPIAIPPLSVAELPPILPLRGPFR